MNQRAGWRRAIMFLLCFSGRVARAASSPRVGAGTTACFVPSFRQHCANAAVARCFRCLHATAYSPGTLKRIEGMDRGDELAKMADKMNVNEDQLVKLLSNRLGAMGPVGEKAEFIDWLISPSKKKIVTKTPPASRQKEPPKTTTATRKKKHQESAGPQTPSSSRTLQHQEGASTIDDQALLTNTQFADHKDLHPASKRAVTEVMGLQTMTEIQAKTFAAASSGQDVLGRARTGTGKTLAFLLPAIERILQSGDGQGENIGVLVISPTRELAAQIADQAEKLLTFHPGMTCQVMFGGTKMGRDLNQLKRKLPAVLVATPGRLLDHMQSTEIGRLQFGRDIMSRTPVVVLDETDRLLDMGFRREIQKILSYLPKGSMRQTLLFSATIPPDLKTIMSQTMKDDYIEVDCINDGDGATHTNSRVKQSHVIVPFNDRYVSSVLELVSLAMKDDDGQSKLVVFFPTARMVSFFAELFNVGLDIPVLELHSRKSQSYRNKMSNNFREAKSGVLFTSDVSARGVDYPNVSHVIQIGIPESREQYIHRLGRTGRAGLEGKGWLVLSPFESLFLQELKGIDVPSDKRLRQLFDDPLSSETVELLLPVLDRIRRGDKKLTSSAQGAYQAFLGYYLGKMKLLKMKRKEHLVEIANEFAGLMGLNEIPPLTSQLVGKMGLRDIPGLNVKGTTKQGGRDSRNRRGHEDGRRAPNSGRQTRGRR